MENYPHCDLCGLNRATLHLDEVVDSAIQMTAHLCDDCWYRLGIRIPLGNIWKHIQRHKEDPNYHPPDIPKEEPLFKQDELDDDVLGGLGVVEPTEPIHTPRHRLDEVLGPIPDSPPSREITNMDDFSDLLENPPPTAIPPDPKPLGMRAIHVDRVHPAIVSLLPIELLTHCTAIPVGLEGINLTVAIANPFDKVSIANLELAVDQAGLKLTLAFADEMEILKELKRHGGSSQLFGPLS